MAKEIVTNYRCDRCGRSEIGDKATILTLTIRHRAGDKIPGQGKTEISKHVCAENCLKIIDHTLQAVRKGGRPKGSTNNATPTTTPPTTKGNTKSQGRVSRTKSTPATPVFTTRFDAQPAHIRAVLAVTRKPHGGWAKGHNWKTERALLAEAQSKVDNRK